MFYIELIKLNFDKWQFVAKVTKDFRVISCLFAAKKHCANQGEKFIERNESRFPQFIGRKLLF